MKRAVFLSLAIVLLVGLPQAGSASFVKLGWPDLLPKLPPLQDPLEKLTFDQRIELETVLWVQQLTQEEREQRPEVVAEAKLYEENLRQSGIILDEFIAEFEVFDKKAQERGAIVRDDLNGKTVQIDGFLLPLEFSEEGETEFLLVPYVGACIHVPPPPPNQIALVSLDEKFQVSEIFAPVRITGTLQTKAASAKLFLVDGEADISLGYHITKATVQLLK